ncbi:MAG: GH1 family beta-glucosidase [Clostridiales bacterium]|nr:GH1 family beta-glucosidase [Clostridiales bacterium]HBM79324.1 beta-glucosidase [Clostridiaceae bacterium]
MVKFDKDFLFGTATASYQVEGAYNEDGRGMSIWDTFCRKEGKVLNGATGDVACDHYHRYKQDVSMMKDIGVNAYRFSIAWPRIFPQKGEFNQKGLDFYKRLVDELLNNGIKPCATIYHWDLPQWLDDIGGWLNRDVVNWYGEYAEKLFSELGSYIDMWITLNEPWCSSFLGYYTGAHAPGHKDFKEALTAAHHLLLSHGTAIDAFRELNINDSKIGITLNLTPVYPKTDSKDDKEAAVLADGCSNRWFLDPVFKGAYPKDIEKLIGDIFGELDFVRNGDLKTISQQVDFLGINYYSRAIVEKGNDGMFNVKFSEGPGKKTDMGWEISPESLYLLLTRLKNEYTGKLPLYITENGAAFKDKVSTDSHVHDPERVEYLKEHLHNAGRFIEEGGNLKGYFLWSLMDNFEWAYGYSKRFGIVYVDYKTQKRILKDSALWYKKLISERTL